MSENTQTKPKATKATSPAKAEVEAEDGSAETITVTINIRGTDVELALPATFDDADPDAVVALEEEKPTVAFKALIGSANWSTLKRHGWTAKDFKAVVADWQEQVGLGNG